MSSRWANTVTTLALAGLIVGISLSSPRWARLFQRPLQLKGEEAPPSRPPEPEPSNSAERKLSVKLFFEAQDHPGLVIEERSVPFFNDLSQQLRTVVEELIQGSKAGLLPTFPPEAKVLEVFVTARGVAYVDLSKEAAESPTGDGSDGERLAVYSVVDSITASFPAIKQVQILIEDHPVDTLRGHVDLSRPLGPDMTLLADSVLSPVEASPTPAPTVQPEPPPPGAR